MCGIVGIAGDLFLKEEKTMQSLFLLDYFRGTDSTGFASVSNQGAVKVAKLATDPITLFQYPKFKDALNGNSSKLFLGHNRASTSGVTNNYNAHPFQCDHITGVMNGTLEYFDKGLLEKNLSGQKFDVDSEALFAHMAAFGVKDTISILTEGKDAQRGAWSLVWYDKKEDSLNFLRNKWRPMWLAWDKGFKRLFFASKWEFIHHAARMADPAYDLERFEYQDKDKKGQYYRFYHVPDDNHWKFNLEELKKGSETRPKPVAKVIRGKEPMKQNSSSGGSYKPTWDPFQRGGNQVGFHQQKTTNPTSTTTSHLGTDRAGQGMFSVYASKPDEKPYCHVLNRDRFEELVQFSPKSGSCTGCSFCFKDINYGDVGLTVYEQQDTILCAECSGHDEEKKETPALKYYTGSQHFLELKRAA